MPRAPTPNGSKDAAGGVNPWSHELTVPLRLAHPKDPLWLGNEIEDGRHAAVKKGGGVVIDDVLLFLRRELKDHRCV